MSSQSISSQGQTRQQAQHREVEPGLQAARWHHGAPGVIGRIRGVAACTVPQRAALVLHLQQQVVPCSRRCICQLQALCTQACMAEGSARHSVRQSQGKRKIISPSRESAAVRHSGACGLILQTWTVMSGRTIVHKGEVLEPCNPDWDAGHIEASHYRYKQSSDSICTLLASSQGAQ